MNKTVPLYGFGSGGTSLNFKVVGGTTEPSNPKENTIWVNTDTEITGWYFASKQPEDMKEGEVWVSTGKSSTAAFNALKKNGIQLYPIYAKQYVSGALVDKTAKSYRDGEWGDWILPIFYHGEKIALSKWVETYANVTINDKIIISHQQLNFSHYFAIWTEEKIDLTERNKICLEGMFDSVYGGYLGVSPVPFSSTTSHNSVIAKVALDTTNTRWELDISSLSGRYYCCVFSFGGYIGEWTSGEITKWWLE